MPSTPRGLHYPQGTDIPDVPFDMEKLAESVESRSSIPVVANVADIATPFDGMIVFETSSRMMKVFRTGIGWSGIGTAFVSNAVDFPTGTGAIGYVQDQDVVVVNTSGGQQTIPTGTRIFIGGSGYTPSGTRRINDILIRYR